MSWLFKLLCLCFRFCYVDFRWSPDYTLSKAAMYTKERIRRDCWSYLHAKYEFLLLISRPNNPPPLVKLPSFSPTQRPPTVRYDWSRVPILYLSPSSRFLSHAFLFSLSLLFTNRGLCGGDRSPRQKLNSDIFYTRNSSKWIYLTAFDLWRIIVFYFHFFTYLFSHFA